MQNALHDRPLFLFRNRSNIFMSYRRVGRVATSVLCLSHHASDNRRPDPIREALQEYLRAQPEFECGLMVDSVEAFLAALAAGAVPLPPLLLSDINPMCRRSC